MTLLMIKKILIFCLIVAGIYFFLKKFTMYRCPQCHSRHMVKMKNDDNDNERSSYMCQECGHIVKKEK